MEKVYTCVKYPSLTMGNRIKFNLGRFVTSDPTQQMQIETHPWFNCHIKLAGGAQAPPLPLPLPSPPAPPPSVVEPEVEVEIEVEPVEEVKTPEPQQPEVIVVEDEVAPIMHPAPIVTEKQDTKPASHDIRVMRVATLKQICISNGIPFKPGETRPKILNRVLKYFGYREV